MRFFIVCKFLLSVNNQPINNVIGIIDWRYAYGR
jgi:hypothetical protein